MGKLQSKKQVNNKKKRRHDKKAKKSLRINPEVTICKYYKYTSLETLEKIIENQSLKVSNPTEFNDPFDCNFPGYHSSLDMFSRIKPLIMKDFNNEYNQLKSIYSTNSIKKMMLSEIPELSGLNDIIIEALDDLRNNWDAFIGEYRVLSLTTQKDNILMWSHYAEYHKGAVLCFDLSNDSHFNDIKKVNYDIDGKKLSNFIDQIIKLFIEALVQNSVPTEQFFSQADQLFENSKFSNKLTRFFLLHFMPFFFIKKKDWEYEDEYRLVLNKKQTNNGFIGFKTESLKEVIFGVKSQGCNDNNLLETIKNKFPHTEIYFAKKTNGKLDFEKHNK